MAPTNTRANNYSFLIFFIILVLGHEMLHVEARHLKSKHSKTLKGKNNGNYYNPSSNFGSSTHATEGTTKAENVDGSEPSGPGHSPGVGHSIQN